MISKHCNLATSADALEWRGQKWSILNHFIPSSEAEVDAHDRFESDFKVQCQADKSLSAEAIAVLNAGRTLWKACFAHTGMSTVRSQFRAQHKHFCAASIFTEFHQGDISAVQHVRDSGMTYPS